MATKKIAFAGPMKKQTSNIKISSTKAKVLNGKNGTKPMKDCGCGGKHGK